MDLDNNQPKNNQPTDNKKKQPNKTIICKKNYIFLYFDNS